MTVTIPSEWEKFVAERVAAGRSADEVLAAALQALHQKEQYEAKLAELRAAVAEGEADIAAGRVAELDARAILAEVRAARAGRAAQ